MYPTGVGEKHHWTLAGDDADSMGAAFLDRVVIQPAGATVEPDAFDARTNAGCGSARHRVAREHH
ncbi:MAG TPA: hypothetical protein VKE70_34170 [Candidatus Solibacter sp.]|nr:hypothetical protein [Candidatus Solibacter sp.]